MPDLIKFGFSGGVFSPKLAMRSDLKKFDLGLAYGKNFFIEYTGGASTRSGTEFIDYIQDDDEPARLVEFAFNRNVANTYAILFSKNRIRFLQNGAYVLETTKTITSATSTTITLNAHGYSNGDWVKISGETYEITAATTNTFQLLYTSGAAVNTTGFGGKGVARIYTISSPYATADLQYLTFSQYRDELYINSTDYQPKKLRRSAATSWSLIDVTPSANPNPPTSLTLTPSSAGTTGVVFAVTMVDTEGRESFVSSTGIALNRLSVNYSATAGHMALSWTKPAAGKVAYYKVYRSLLVDGAQAHYGMELGYVGRTFFTKFTDSNIVPDFSHTPPQMEIPIVGGQIFSVDISAGGSGYTDASTITPSGGGGTSWSGKPIVEGGAVVGVRILNPGFNYVGSPLSFTVSGGTGAVITATPTDVNGNYPATSAMIQQRRVFAGTENYPGTLFGSRVGDPPNFFSSGLNLATDPYALTLDSEQLTPIRFIMPYPEGLFVFQDTGVTQVRGIDDGVIKVGSTKAQELTEDGAARLQPIQIKRDYLYLNTARTSVYALGPSNIPQYYVPQDISIFSEHYFRADNPIVSWTWAKSPHKLLWAARSDGTFLSLAYVSEQEVTAWSDHSTQGFVEDIETVLENEIDRPYMIVQRQIGGVWRRYIERMALREVLSPDEMWAVDCGLRTNLTYPAATITVQENNSFGYSSNDPNVIVRFVAADAAVFNSNSVGKIVRVGEARGTVIAYINVSAVFVAFERWFNENITDLTLIDYRSWRQGEWSMTGTFSSVSGLSHIEGQYVDVLADGKVVTGKRVLNGSVTLDSPASFVLVGLPYSAKMKTLPMTVSDQPIEGRYKAPKNLAVRLFDSRGPEFGDGQGDLLFPLLPHGEAPAENIPRFLQGMYEVSIAARMDLDGAITVEKNGPQHVTVLGYVAEVEFGN